MNEQYQSDVPVLMNITLFKNNYFDQKLLSIIKQNSLYYRVESENKFTVSSWDMRAVIDENLKGILDDIKTSTPMEFSKKVNSIYFISELLERYSNLRYFTVNVSEAKNTSRLLWPNGPEGTPVINFDFKVIHSILDFPTHLDSAELKIFNRFLIDIGLMPKDLFRKGPPYVHINTMDFLTKIDLFVELVGVESAEVDRYTFILELVSELINPKIEMDNPTCILITDYPK